MSKDGNQLEFPLGRNNGSLRMVKRRGRYLRHRKMEDHQEMLQDEDTQSAVKDKNADNMRIEDDTQWAFGDPAAKDRRMGIPDDLDVRDQFLQAFREMIDAGKGSPDSKNMLVEGLPRVPSGKDPPVAWKTILKNSPGYA